MEDQGIHGSVGLRLGKTGEDDGSIYRVRCKLIMRAYAPPRGRILSDDYDDYIYRKGGTGK